MSDRLRDFIRFIIQPENIITIVGVLVAGVLTYLGIRSKDIPQALTGIITVLGTLAIIHIISGYESSKTRKSIERIENLVRRPSSLFTSRAKLDATEPFDQFLSHGQDILIIGSSLLGTIGPLRTLFKTISQRGTKLRFLLLDPNSSGLEFAARSHGVSVEAIRGDINASLAHLRQLDDAVGSGKGGTMEYRFLQNIADASVVMRDGNLVSGEIRYELYLYQTDVVERPMFRLTPADGQIFQRYRSALERLWNDSRAPDAQEAS